ncbi:endonuclease/exonuclease/phosphatase family protein [Nonomuraea lactucae]|uniref:endonuclease/exonuclease/phosphatase family protein n=1 Tax=Nonomuraea lactucae TaxID=2249762 RepID=UPI000DE1D6BF|nr:endonuclease/exonuclease/phosphatase family protein [Nonomuraea lactucae]
MRRTIPIAIAALTLTGLAAPAYAAAPDGKLALASTTVKSGEPINLSYSTPRPDPRNWIGLYNDPGNGPVEEKYVGPSLKWVYIPAASGTASLPTDGLEPGNYVVYALAKDGYAWLAQPAKLKVVSNETLHFVTQDFTLRNARAASPYTATVKGTLRGQAASFRKVEGPRWLTVGDDGTVTGTPPASSSAKTATVRIEARSEAGESATATVRIRVRPPGARLVPELKAMSWNLWHGGSQVRNGREKQLKFLLDRDVDVVGLQETSSTSAKALADALGWDYFQAGPDMGIISRYPIVSRGPLPAQSGLAGITARIRLDDRREDDLVLWNVHLGYTPYGPYDACFGKMSTDRLLAREVESGRTPQIEKIMTAMAGDLGATSRTPVLLVGDFNAPSHLDWIPAAKRCGLPSMAWPTSVAPARAGMKDSYRVAHPDPVAEPGITWSPIYKTFTGGYGHDSHIGEPEPQDRIDFVHFKGGLRVKASDAVVEGTPRPIPDHQDNTWTSDHAAVLTTFAVR